MYFGWARDVRCLMHLNIEALANGTANLNEQLLEDTLYEVALAELET